MPHSHTHSTLEILNTMSETQRTTADALSLGVAFATISGWLPYIAAVFSIVWSGLRIYDWLSDRWQRWKNGDSETPSS